eukprot:2166007-Rhodomonas_salina.1
MTLGIPTSTSTTRVRACTSHGAPVPDVSENAHDVEPGYNVAYVTPRAPGVPRCVLRTPGR